MMMALLGAVAEEGAATAVWPSRSSQVTDAFPYSNGNLSSNAGWTDVLDNWEVDSNEVVLSSNNANHMVTNDTTLDDDQYVRAALGTFNTPGSGSNRWRLMVRVTDEDNNYNMTVVRQSSGNVITNIRKFTGGSETSLFTSVSITHTPGDIYTLEVVGTELRCYQNATRLDPGGVTDSDHTSGLSGVHGIVQPTSSVLDLDWDDFEAGNMV